MFKNTASQKITVYVFDSTTNLPKTGDAANLTAYRSLDDGTVTVLTDTSATELDATNAKGFYVFDATQAETNGDKNLYTCKSSTANMVCLAMPAVIYTVPSNFQTGVADVQTRLPAALTSNGNMKSSLMEILTTALTETAGLLAGGFKKFFNIATPTGTLNSIPDAVAGANNGLPTTNGTKLNQTADLTAGQSVGVSGDFSATMKTSGATFVGTALATFFTSAAQLVTDIWGATTRLLTAGTNIVLAKGTGVTGFNDLSAAQVNSEADTALADYDAPTHTELTAELATADDAILARLPAALSAGGNMKSDVLAVSGDTTAADTLEALMDGSIVAQVNDAGGTITAFIADGFTETTNDHFKGRLITFLTGVLAGQQTSIVSYTGATQTFTVVALTEAPANNDFFVIS